MLLVLLACSTPPSGHGVYRSGPNAVVRGARAGTVKVWGADGTVDRIGSASGDNTLVGQVGPLWITDKEIPSPTRAPAVSAALIETMAFRLKSLYGAPEAGAEGPAPSVGVWVRSAVKVRQLHAPPVYLVSAVRDDHGAGKLGAAGVKREGEDCKAVVAVLDVKAETILASMPLDLATRTCAVPGIVPPVDRDGDGGVDFLTYGQEGEKGFRAWFSLVDGKTLVAGESDIWEAIPTVPAGG